MEEDGSMYEPIVTLPGAYWPIESADVSIMMLCHAFGPQLGRPQTPEWGLDSGCGLPESEGNRGR